MLRIRDSTLQIDWVEFFVATIKNLSSFRLPRMIILKCLLNNKAAKAH